MKNHGLIGIYEKEPVYLITNELDLVPIKPLCKLIGVSEKSQYDKIYKDYVLRDVVHLSKCIGTDGKKYKMFCIEKKYVFLWLYGISYKNVLKERQESFRRFHWYITMFFVEPENYARFHKGENPWKNRKISPEIQK